MIAVRHNVGKVVPMLIQFKVKNFRSFKDEQIFSMVASNFDKTKEGCLIEPELPGISKLRFVKGAALYGANASGKSNLYEAMRYVKEFVVDSATKRQPEEATGVQPFKLDKDSVNGPSEFEMTFVADNTRYIFGFSASAERVIEEYLYAFPNGVQQRWYHRIYEEKSKQYNWSKATKAFKQDKSLQEKTRPNSLYLSVAPQFNHEQLTPIYNWFKQNIRFIRCDTHWGSYPWFTAAKLHDEKFRERLLTLLRSADVGIADAVAKRKSPDSDEFQKIKETLARIRPGRDESELASTDFFKYDIYLSHIGSAGNPVTLDYDNEESAGTKSFFALIGPWLDILDNGYTVFVDEIETSLHPTLVKELLKLLFSKENNINRAQIIFTTHNPLLLDTSLMRRDQFWFTEKTDAGSTVLYPLTDFSPRNREALAKGYLSGRYGGIPNIPEGFAL